jgi:hypothetical protein
MAQNERVTGLRDHEIISERKAMHMQTDHSDQYKGLRTIPKASGPRVSVAISEEEQE